MSIATLSTIAARHFAGNANLTGDDADSLRGQLNTIIEKINEALEGLADGSLDAIRIGDGSAGTYYGGSNDSYFEVDGVNPPRVMKMQWLDQTTGLWKTVVVSNGSFSIS